MSNELQVFTNEQFGEVRTVEEDGTVLFCGNDIAVALGYSNPRKALIDHCKGVTKRDTLTAGGTQSVSFIPEGDVYRLIVHSKLPKAQEFECWVFDEVLPTIRKHGMYAMDELLDNPDMMIAALEALKAERAARKALEAENAAMMPKALFADAVAASQSSILVGEMAKILRQNGVKDMGGNRFFEWLRENGYLMKQGSSKNLPTQRSMEMKLFEIREGSVTNPDGSIRVTKTPKVTGKGQQYFVNLFLKADSAPVA